MGIKHLWTVLTPFCERKPLYELQRKTVAVDLSCWICEAQNIANYQVQPRMYLRNLYFRACYLLLMEVNLVFVLEGKAPELKYQTIAARNEIQFKGAKPKTAGVKTGKDRTRFHFVLKQCEEMLALMGIVCITGKGEAESLCAYLNEDGLVDGCISQDSDCFAYGAKVVYRNFSISTQGPYAASGGAVDVYDVARAYKNLNFGRNKIIAMALLCGSDYSDGVLGIGKESVLKLFEKLTDEETLDRLRSWKLNPELYERFETQISDKDICTSCGHHGKIQSHTKNGCNACGTTKGCDSFKFKEERLSIKNEVNMRTKALQDPNFPNEDLIKEFLVKKDRVSQLNLKWRQPDLVNFIKFAAKYLQWEEIYAFEKILPILTRWQCFNYKLIKEGVNTKGVLHPKFIKKVRNPKGVPSYEIVWSDTEGNLKGIVPENQLLDHNIDVEKLWSTIEPQEVVEKAYPKLVEEYKQSKIKPKKVGKRKKKEANIDNISDLLKNTSICDTAPKRTRKTTAVKKIKNSKKPDEILKDLNSSFNDLAIDRPKQKTTTLDNFLKKAVLNSQNLKNPSDKKKNEGFSDVKPCYTSTPSKQNCPFNLDSSNFGDEDDLDLSDIVDGIISRPRPDYVTRNLKKIDLNIFEIDPAMARENSSSFFITNPVENDLFERTFNMEDDNGESTEEYEFNENCFNDKNKEESEDKPQPEEDDDSFCDKYIPLYERLKKRK